MMRRPPRSTLFPYTDALPISVAERPEEDRVVEDRAIVVEAGPPETETAGSLSFGRSEEHTSELQSRRDLVCRLLLEKKKKTKTLGGPTFLTDHRYRWLARPRY